MRHALLAVLATAVLAAGCGGSEEGAPEPEGTRPGTRSGDRALQDLSGVDQLRDAFNRDRGSPRLLLLLSPT